jgi:hypothetical protein
VYPQPLPGREREWVEWILPDDRAGYKSYRNAIQSMMIIGEGRRGKGEIILGHGGGELDFSSPLAPVFAYGAVVTSVGTISITLREIRDDQVSVEIVGQHADEVPNELVEIRRWTYSTWSPGNGCPQCGGNVREVGMRDPTNVDRRFVLAICEKDRRLWVHEAGTQVNHLIPVTNYYNELMLHKNIREPNLALDSKRLFTDLPAFSDDDLAYAFLTYNKLKAKVRLEGPVVTEIMEHRGITSKLRRIFSTKKP